VTPLHELKEKLCRELSQSEYSAIVQPRREARRLGDIPPAHCLLRIAAHAAEVRPRFDALIAGRRATVRGVELGKVVGNIFSMLRHYLFDRLIDTERSYRGTLLGLDHGIDIVRMLQAICERDGDEHLEVFCEEWLSSRVALVEGARACLTWFTSEPAIALQSGLRRALVTGR
jgi:hypothetical protein